MPQILTLEILCLTDQIEPEGNMKDCNVTSCLKPMPDTEGFWVLRWGNVSTTIGSLFQGHMWGICTAFGSKGFLDERQLIQKQFQGRPIPKIHMKNVSHLYRDAQVYAKHGDLNHTDPHNDMKIFGVEEKYPRHFPEARGFLGLVWRVSSIYSVPA